MGASREKKARKELKLTQAEGKRKKDKDKVTSLGLKLLAGFVIALVAIGVVVFILVAAHVPQRTLAAMTVGDVNVSPAEYSIFYGNTYENQYYLLTQQGTDLSDATMKQALLSSVDGQTDEAIREVVGLAQIARKNNLALSEDNKELLSSVMENLAATAANQNYSVDQYLTLRYGPGVNQGIYEKYVTDSFLADQWRSHYAHSNTFDQSRYDAFYAENPDSVDSVTCRYFWISVDDYSGETGDTAETLEELAKLTAETKVEEFKNQVVEGGVEGGEEAFKEAAIANTDETSKEYVQYDPDNATLAKNVSLSNWSGDQLAWLTGERTYGDIESFPTEDGTAYQILYFISRQRDDFYPVTIRQVAFNYKNEDGTALTAVPTDKQKEAALEKAQKAFDDWKAGAASEDSFAVMANELSDDRDADAEAIKDDGGLYENVPIGSMPAPYEEWCFNPSRKAGDSGLVETNFGVFLLYYVSRSDRPHWVEIAHESLANQDVDASIADIEIVRHPLGMRFAHKSDAITKYE